jgi:signal transduction histidine kinase
VAQPEVRRTWVVRFIVSDLAVSMLIAFPFVLVPVWVAVSRGLRPLDQLSRRIAARSPDDLEPLGLAPRHAELKPLVRAIDGLMDALRAKVRREHAFVHDAAHELRTPMAVVSAQAHALAHARDAHERAQASARLEDAIARASNLVEQLLQLARFDGPEAARTVIDVAGVTQEELALLAPQALARGLDLSLEAPDELPWAIELGAFRAILQNLVGNAVRYVQQGGRVVVGLAAIEDRMHLSVADDGPGIDAAQRERVFERFVRGAEHDVPGSGLGLAIVRQAAARSGATVQLVDGLPHGEGRRGCRFQVIFVR